jgi:hypothetical protein
MISGTPALSTTGESEADATFENEATDRGV